MEMLAFGLILSLFARTLWTQVDVFNIKSLVIIALLFHGCCEEEPGDNEPEVPEVPACMAEFGDYNMGPILPDGCRACRLTCDTMECRDYDYKGGYVSECHISIDYVYRCLQEGTITITFINDGCPPQCWNVKKELVTECR